MKMSPKKERELTKCQFPFAPPLGLEPRTYGLTVRRSNQLS